jgi:nitroimidazol reductase NimA-like FMN-containing flavoprotein (pyridoxamine 5'-phosphate oxidase superfamily)
MRDDPQPLPSRLLRGREILADALVRELLDARVVGVLCTHEGDGPIHAVPMWFAAVGGRIALATSARSRKVANLERDHRATLVLHDSRAGTEICGVSLRGRCELVRGEEARELVDAVHARYVTPGGLVLPAAAEFLASDDVALLLEAESAFTWDERGSPATRALRAAGGALPLVPTSPAPGLETGQQQV